MPEHDGQSSVQPAPSPVLRAEDITKAYGSLVACSDVDFDIRAGEVHALLGENGAGKSTLMKILYGLVRPDRGSVFVHDRRVRLRSPRDAKAVGIGMVFQHFELVDNLTVCENVALGTPWWRRIRLATLASELAEFSAQHGLEVSPHARVGDLPIGLQQRVEIVKALFGGAQILIMDEPTAVLSPVEWSGLQQVIRSLAGDGKSIVFIDHKLHEALAVADRCTVLRRGRKIGTVGASDADERTIARMMVGRDVSLLSRNAPQAPGEPVLELRSVSTDSAVHDANLEDLSFTVHRGEVFGVAGVEGNGQSTLADVLTGLVAPAGGEVLRHRASGAPGPAADALSNVGVIPADRHALGSAADRSLRDNLIYRHFAGAPLSKRGLLQFGAIEQHCTRLCDTFDVRSPGIHAAFSELSGGNQQKAVIAREMHDRPALLVAVHPTRGLDVGAIEFVYEVVRTFRREGGAVALISEELDEILALADRFVVLFKGRQSSVMRPDEVDLTDIGLKMTGASP